MSLNSDVDLEEFVMAKDDLSGADIKAVCTEAGLLALRERRMRVTKVDFTTAREKVSIACSFVVSVSLPFAGTIQEERGYSRGTLLIDVWSCFSRGLQLFSPRVYNLPGPSEDVKLPETNRKSRHRLSRYCIRHQQDQIWICKLMLIHIIRGCLRQSRSGEIMNLLPEVC